MCATERQDVRSASVRSLAAVPARPEAAFDVDGLADDGLDGADRFDVDGFDEPADRDGLAGLAGGDVPPDLAAGPAAAFAVDVPDPAELASAALGRVPESWNTLATTTPASARTRATATPAAGAQRVRPVGPPTRPAGGMRVESCARLLRLKRIIVSIRYEKALSSTGS